MCSVLFFTCSRMICQAIMPDRDVCFLCIFIVNYVQNILFHILMAILLPQITLCVRMNIKRFLILRQIS